MIPNVNQQDDDDANQHQQRHRRKVEKAGVRHEPADRPQERLQNRVERLPDAGNQRIVQGAERCLEGFLQNRAILSLSLADQRARALAGEEFQQHGVGDAAIQHDSRLATGLNGMGA
ncbi:hypothetical protein KXW36_009983, partial [Aspergillus fumigatus]